MIFTVGHRTSYERYFAEQGTPKKLGREKDYTSGSVWKTAAEARAHAPEGYSVYGVLADWEKDTSPSLGGRWHDLLVTSVLIMVAE